MGIVRVSPGTAGRLAQVFLPDLELKMRQDAASRLRAQDWRENLDPARDVRAGEPTAPPVRERYACLSRAVELERAATTPSATRYLVPEAAVREVLGA